ncbi:hypothetical protein LTR86_001712 [Recurvomyces mirabilis]|nr:hypothetical protein LTR86_001712 [Recurvomyces mirabilis]
MTPSLDNPGDIVTAPGKLAHVVLRTSNFNKLRDFYLKFLGATVSFENEFMALLTYDDEHHRLGIIIIPDLAAKNPGTCGLEHIAFTYSDLQTLALVYLQRQKHGIEPFWCINHGPTISVYTHDPDGNILESQVDCMTVEGATAFMTSDAYQTNPIGVDFNMKDLINRLKSGESEDEIKKRPASGPRGIDSVPA